MFRNMFESLIISPKIPLIMLTDEKKRDSFRSDLSLKLQDRVASLNNFSFNELVSIAIVQEDTIWANQEDKKRKHAVGNSSSTAPPKYKLAISSPSRQTFHASML